MEDIDLQLVADKLGVRKHKDKRYFCPVHDKDTPDLMIEPNVFNCLASGQSGGGYKAVTLVMHIKQVDKQSALRWLRQQFPEYFDDVDVEDVENRNEVIDCLTFTVEKANDKLMYMKEKVEIIKNTRNLTEDEIRDFKIGYLDQDVLDEVIDEFGFETVKKSGLVNDDGYCNLMDRLLIPHNKFGKTYYVAGRKMNHEMEEGDKKYKKLFRTDYNENIIFEVTENRDELVITEGYFDLISVAKSGYDVVSPCTVRFRKKDISKLVSKAEMYDKVYIAMDSDRKGFKGAKDTAQKLVEKGIDPYMVDIEGHNIKDMDDWTNINGYDVEPLLKGSKTYIQQKIDKIQEMKDNNDLQYSNKVEEVLELVKDWNDVQLEPIIDNLPGWKRDLKNRIKELKKEEEEHKKQTSVTTVFEEEKFMNSERPVKKRLQGVVDDTFFIVTWLYNQDFDMYTPVVITEDGEIKQIKNKRVQFIKDYGEEEYESLDKDRKDALDVDFVEIGDREVKFKQKIAKSPTDKLTTPTYELVDYLRRNKELPSRDDLFEEIVQYLKDYVDHHDERWFDFWASYIIHTYILEPLNYTFYLCLKGKPSTGKTTLQKTMSHLQFMGVEPGNSTAATTARMSHMYQASVHIEEFEKMRKDDAQLAQGLINTGQRKNSTYNITNIDKLDLGDQIQEIYTFSPKTFSVNSIPNNWEKSFISRNFVIPMVRMGDKDLKNADDIELVRSDEIEELRNKLTAFIMMNWRGIKDSIDDHTKSNKREDQKIGFIKGIITYFTDISRAEDVVELVEHTESISEIDLLSEVDRYLIEYLSERFTETNSNFITEKYMDIANHINRRRGVAEEDQYGTTSKSVGSHLEDLGMYRDKSEKVKIKGVTNIRLHKDDFLDSLERFGVKYIYDEIKEEYEPEKDDELTVLEESDFIDSY